MRLLQIILGIAIIAASVWGSTFVGFPTVAILWVTSFVGGLIAGVGLFE